VFILYIHFYLFDVCTCSEEEAEASGGATVAFEAGAVKIPNGGADAFGDAPRILESDSCSVIE
jgi:hypothetical protein